MNELLNELAFKAFPKYATRGFAGVAAMVERDQLTGAELSILTENGIDPDALPALVFERMQALELA